MPKKKKPAKRKRRALVWREEVGFSGWGCEACGWVRPSRRFIAADKTPSQDTQEAFDRHECKRCPRWPRKREDFSQAAARIVREATKD